jgi:hypothetical protein
MDLQLTFDAGVLRGDGNDDVGAFTISGDYSATSLGCNWIKTYLGRHSVLYHGYREGKGIWGRWDIGRLAHGGFHIWPCAASEGETVSKAAAEPRLTSAVAAAPALSKD